MPRRHARRSASSRFAKSSYARRLQAEQLEDRRMLATITVTSALDNTFLDSQVTLREAVMAANQDISVNGSEAGAGADTIVFDLSLAGQTIELGGLELELTEALTIDATPLAGGVTIDGQENSRLFNITTLFDDFTFAGLTLTGGRTTGDNAGRNDNTYSGGAIRAASGNLTLDRSTIVGNSTTGNYAAGGGVFARNVTVTNSTISGNTSGGNGGGVYTADTLTVTDSTISGNTSTGLGGGISSFSTTLANSSISGNTSGGDGGGIFTGRLTLNSSTVSENRSSGNGGGVFALITGTLTNSTLSRNFSIGRGGGAYGAGTLIGSTVTGNISNGEGGGIFARDVTLNNSTVSGNVSGGDGGGVYAVVDLMLASSTVFGNRTTGAASAGGGIYVTELFGGEQTVQNSIIASNTVSTGGSAPDLLPSPNSPLDVDFSLIGDADGLAISGLGNQIGDSTGVGVLDPLLGPLADNGGLTQTHALLPGSPAIDAASPVFDLAAIPQDQRGAPFSRAFGGRVDLGAYERQTVAGLSLVVDEVSDQNDGDVAPGALSLREAIGLANGSIGPDTITFGRPFNRSQTLELVDQLPTISERLTIEGPGQELLTLDAGDGDDGQFATGDGFRHFDLDDGLTSRINVTLSGLTLTGGDVPFLPGDPVRDGVGGAIRSRENLNLNDVTLTANAATEGGGVSSQTGELEVTRSTISDNHATAFAGGGIHHNGVNLIVTDSTISGNRTLGDFAPGGGVYTAQSLELNQSTISGNTTAGEASPGGGVFAGQGFEITRSTIALNETLDPQGVGGGLYQSGGQTSSLSGTILSANRTGSGNGADFAVGPGQFALTANFSLIGSSVTPTAGANNVVNNSPRLGALADNGGPTPTHLPQPGSPAIDAGNPLTTGGFDQRGGPFERLIDGNDSGRAQIDIGSVEFDPDPPLVGDFNLDNVVNTADYAVWRDTRGQTGPDLDADANRDGVVDREDYSLWRQNVGATTPPSLSSLTVSPLLTDQGAPSPSPVTAPVEPAADPVEPRDTAFAMFAPTGATTTPPPSPPDAPLAETPISDTSLLLFALNQPTDEEAGEEPGVATQEEDESDTSDEDSLIASLS